MMGDYCGGQSETVRVLKRGAAGAKCGQVKSPVLIKKESSLFMNAILFQSYSAFHRVSSHFSDAAVA